MQAAPKVRTEVAPVVRTVVETAGEASGDIGSDHTATTIAARLTGIGRSAIAVIGVRGIQSGAAIQACFQPATESPMQVGQIRYGQWKSGESVVVTPIADDYFEIHCHGGTAAIDCILRDLNDAGAEIVDAEPFVGSGKSQWIIEAESVLKNCVTARTAAIAMHQVRGQMERWAERFEATQAEHSSGVWKLEPAPNLLIQQARFTSRMTTPFRVVLIGMPNVGKSSLVNAIVGYQRSITTDIAGTTRDVLHAETVIEGVPIRLSDTAGVRESKDEIESEGVRRAHIEINSADVVIRVRDPDHDFVELVGIEGQSIIDVFNKADLSSQAATTAIAVSARTGDGLPQLMQAIVDAIVPAGIDQGGPAIINQRQLDWLQRLIEPNTRESPK